MNATTYSDGGNREDIAAAAAILVMPSGETHEATKKLPGGSTNMEAEYEGFILALELALRHGVTSLVHRMDNQTVVRHMNGTYKVREARMRAYFDRAIELGLKFASVSIEWIPREKNRETDKLCRKVMDGKKTSSRSRPAPLPAFERQNPFIGREGMKSDMLRRQGTP